MCRLIDALLAKKGRPLIEDAARLLGISPRSLQRLLNEEGTSYSDLLDRCRCKAACQALEHTQQSIKDIATVLGYSDPTHFTRAFRRWTGTAPLAYRNQSLGGQEQ
jgi:AraC-like DNA-binding protein